MSRALPLLLLCAAGAWMLLLRQGFLIDDAYISFRYAWNLAHGHGLVWNAGTRVEGYTNLLWTTLLAPFSAWGLDLTWPALLGSLGFSLASVDACFRLGRRLFPTRSPLELALPGTLLASIPSLAHASTAGMEGPAFTFLVLSAVIAMVEARTDAAGLALLGAYLTRPEGALVALVLFAFALREGRRPWRALATVSVGIAAHVAIRLAYYGHPLPNTYYAKVIYGGPSLVRGLEHLLGFLRAGGWVALPGLLLLRGAGPLRPYLLRGYAIAFVYTLYLVVVGGDHPVWYRFYVPLLPIPVFAACEWARARCSPRVVLGAAPLVFGASVPFAEPVGSVFARVPAEVRRSVDEVDRFFRDEAPRTSFVAAAAVGYFAYRHPETFVLDMWGLNDEHIAHLRVPATVKFGHDKTDLAYVASRKPDYYLLGGPARAIPGYELCAPSRFRPMLVYRRATPLSPSERSLGLPAERSRLSGAPPPCAGATP